MKKSLLWTLVLSCSSLLILDSCGKKNDVWDDSTTSMGSYRRAQDRVLWGSGQGEDSVTAYNSNNSKDNFGSDDDFIALQDEDLKQSFSEVVFAQPKDSPGEEGSFLPGIDGFRIPIGALAQVFQTVYFNTDEFTLKKQEYVQTIHKVANYLKDHPKTYIFIEGYCDQRGPEAYNLALGSRRSNYVRNLLIEKGVNGDQIHTISYGKERLFDSANTPEAWAKNRRAQFKLYETR
ncbi:MAG: OmpA family protein [Rhabdochlamydiaceae bacterium]|nr:OmpA family protein [Rhabdochlamydiaceae bacterium]